MKDWPRVINPAIKNDRLRWKVEKFIRSSRPYLTLKALELYLCGGITVG